MADSDKFITEKELAALAGLSTSSYTNSFATKELITSSTFSSKLKLDTTASSYNNFLFVEAKRISKVLQAFNTAARILTTAFKNIAGYDVSDLECRIFILYNVGPLETDPVYPGLCFTSSSWGIDAYSGSVGTFEYLDASNHVFVAYSNLNNNNLYINGNNVKMAYDNYFNSGSMFVLVVFTVAPHDSSSTPIAYLVSRVYNSGNNVISNRTLITKYKQVSSYDLVPTRIYYDGTNDGKELFNDGSFGEDVSYFYSK